MSDQADGFGRDSKDRIVSVIHEGTVYEIAVMSDDEEAEMTAYLQKQRRKPSEAIQAEFQSLAGNPALQKILAELAYTDMRKGDAVDVVSRKDVGDFIGTKPGLDMIFWFMMRRKKPDTTLAGAVEIISKVSMSDALKDKAEREAVAPAAGEKAKS